MLLTFFRLSTMTPSPAEMRGVQLIHWLPLSVGLAVCLSVTHKWVSFMAVWCISGIFHLRNILPAPRWWDVVLDGGSSSHSSWEPAPCRSGRTADGHPVSGKECNLFTLHQCLPAGNATDNVNVSAETYLISATSVWLLFLCHRHKNRLFYRTTKPKNFCQRPFCFLTVLRYGYSSCDHKDLLCQIHCSYLPALGHMQCVCVRAGAVLTVSVGGTGKPDTFLSHCQTKVILGILYVQVFFAGNCFSF